MQKLTWLASIPFIISLMAFISPSFSPRNFKRLSVIGALIPLLLLINGQEGWTAATINIPWVPAIGVNFHLGIDALSLVFLYLTAIVVLVSVLAVRSGSLPYPHTFYGLAFLLEGLLFGFFMAKDLVLFTFFWESMLIPLYFMITLWGGPTREAAALKFLIYMIAGSCLMVAAVLFLYFTAGIQTFDIDQLAASAGASPHALIACAVFLLAFAVKTPLFPFHAWLPDAYCQASVPGTILLSAILSKAGVYGILRIGYGLFPSIIAAWNPYLLILAITGVLYGGLAAWRQQDYKKLIAYSSFSHVNFVLAGLFVWSQVSHEGAILQAFNHGITISALFLAAGWLEERIGTTRMGIYTGMAKYMPVMCWVTLLFVLSSVALPSTNSFVGELLILFGIFQITPWLAAVLGLTVILSVIYMLRWMQKVYFEMPSDGQPQWKDLRLNEWVVALPLIVLIMWIGIYPSPLLKQIEPAVEKISATTPLKEAL